ncbi:DNA methyltransferase [Bacteroides sp. 224]|uniref:DNA methyltransferase n=1 Tax=Bacteroides sp. 224 TaxID=2302936 RepID=UPI0013D28389|nr:DNA methyltransferase [Bacteroides sp. 224]NDV67184.1 class I SAM-dependent DNA methyltransferase [Bacteroides sp. 224]
MPIKTSLTYSQIGNKLEIFKTPVNKEDIPFMLLSCFGATTTIIDRYKKGNGTVATFDGLLIKKTLAYCNVDTERMMDTLEDMKADEKVKKNAPPILAVSDGLSILAYDPAVDETYENKLSLLYTDYSFFSPIWGIGKYRAFEENDADVKAAYKMAKLHDEIRRENEYANEADLHDLNIFMSRLLFCFFAEDTGIFEKDLFTNAINQFTKADGSDLSEYLSTIFNLMEQPGRDASLNKAYAQFPYVNGGLFGKRIQIPRLGLKARKLILECGSLNWKDINPDIFGSMIQAVVTPELRSGLGMHYTSVPNIMKLIGPLFLDELYEEFYKMKNIFDEKKRKLDIGACNQKDFEKECKSIVTDCRKLLLRMSKMKFFDPACGSGNFLIITYKSLRRLENDILQLILSIDKQGSFNNVFSMIHISQFYGIELDDFACETAILSLWLAEHQMNCKFTEEFGVVVNALPLKANSNIHHGNACRVDWNEVCPHTAEEEVFVMGNPPFAGKKEQNDKNKQDLKIVFNERKGVGIIDYVSAWFMKSLSFMKKRRAFAALVSTNSICQGEHVSILWKILIEEGIVVNFAYKPFKWNNKAKHNANVHCVIIGFSKIDKKNRSIITYNEVTGGFYKKTVNNINPYLLDASNIIVEKRRNRLSTIPEINYGSMPIDNGNLILDFFEKQAVEEENLDNLQYIKPYIGGEEFIKGKERWCIWINDDEIKNITSPFIKDKIEKNRNYRLSSDRKETVAAAETPYKFGEIRQPSSDYVIIPKVSSEKREYIPMGILSKEIIASGSSFVIDDCPVFVFGFLNSKMHIQWVRTIGGKMKSDIQYSSSLCYNTFPFPSISDEKKNQIEAAANHVLDIRDYHIGKTLAELYDPDKMPKDLRQAHHELDLIVDSCYQEKPFENDEERLECLFRLYEEMSKKK